MLRAVLDANVLVSAFIQPDGGPGQILRRWLAERPFDLVSSAAILEEARRALRYPRVRRYLKLSEREIEAVLAIVESSSDLVAGTATIMEVAVDPDDRKVLAAAVDGDADFLVTGDRGLFALGRHAGFRIVRPAAFLAILG